MGPASAGTQMLNLDTHILVFAVSADLRPPEQAMLAQGRWSISAIVLWELAKLVELGRVDMDLDDREVTRTLGRLHVWPIDLAVAPLRPVSTSRAIRQTSSLPPLASCTVFRCSLVIGSYAGRRLCRWPCRSCSQ